MGLFDWFGNIFGQRVIEEKPIPSKNKRVIECIKDTEEVLTEMKEDLGTGRFKATHLINDKALPQLNFTFSNGSNTEFIFADNEKFEIKFWKNGTWTHYWIKSKRLYFLLNEISKKTLENPIAKNPLKNRYNLIVRKIKLRQQEINFLPADSPKREPLINELNTYKKIADRLKKQL